MISKTQEKRLRAPIPEDTPRVVAWQEMIVSLKLPPNIEQLGYRVATTDFPEEGYKVAVRSEGRLGKVQGSLEASVVAMAVKLLPVLPSAGLHAMVELYEDGSVSSIGYHLIFSERIGGSK